MHQLLDRIWCRFFHRRYHKVLEKGCNVPGWHFVNCAFCKTSWPERTAKSEAPAV